MGRCDFEDFAGEDFDSEDLAAGDSSMTWIVRVCVCVRVAFEWLAIH